MAVRGPNPPVDEMFLTAGIRLAAGASPWRDCKSSTVALDRMRGRDGLAKTESVVGDERSHGR